MSNGWDYTVVYSHPPKFKRPYWPQMCVNCLTLISVFILKGWIRHLFWVGCGTGWNTLQPFRTQTGWWFGTCSIFHIFGNNHPNWLSYFSKGFKPPARLYMERLGDENVMLSAVIRRLKKFSPQSRWEPFVMDRNDLGSLPSTQTKSYWKWLWNNSGFSHRPWWFSIVM